MKDIVIGIMILSVGSILAIYFRWFAQFIIEQQNKFWGVSFGLREVRVTEIITMIIAACLIIVGILTIFQIIKFNQ